MSKNEVRIGGSAYGPVATGTKAQATQHHVTIGVAADQDRLRAALAALRQVIDEHAGEIPETDRVRRDVDEVEQESGTPDPDPHRLRDALARIAGRVALVAPVLAAANDLREMVGAMLG